MSGRGYIARTFTRAELALARQLQEWAAVDEHLVATQPAEDVEAFLPARLAEVAPDDVQALADPAAYGYAHRLRSYLTATNCYRPIDSERTVRLTLIAYLAARERLRGIPAYTEEERLYAHALPFQAEAWEVATEIAKRHPLGAAWTEAEVDQYAEVLLAPWQKARAWIAAGVPADVHRYLSSRGDDAAA
mgnify:CR=1 FL=1